MKSMAMNALPDIVINSSVMGWTSSPMPGVWRKPLAREETERGHATSVVRYQAGARFSEHAHPLGEEILVLEGTFSDETGDYCAGTYLRNPEGFRHAPYSEEGCLLLVKLHQFQASDTAHVVIDTKTAAWLPGHGKLQVTPLLIGNSPFFLCLLGWQDILHSFLENRRVADPLSQ